MGLFDIGTEDVVVISETLSVPDPRACLVAV